MEHEARINPGLMPEVAKKHKSECGTGRINAKLMKIINMFSMLHTVFVWGLVALDYGASIHLPSRSLIITPRLVILTAQKRWKKKILASVGGV